MSLLHAKINRALDAVNQSYSFCKMDFSLAIDALNGLMAFDDEMLRTEVQGLNVVIRRYQRCLDFSAHRDDCIPSHVIGAAELAEKHIKYMTEHVLKNRSRRTAEAEHDGPVRKKPYARGDSPDDYEPIPGETWEDARRRALGEACPPAEDDYKNRLAPEA